MALNIQSYKWVIVIWTEHTSTVYLGGSEGAPAWLGARSAKIFQFRVSRLAQNALPSRYQKV